MGSVLFNILAFIVAIGVLITIHEFGHFWVARKMGVKVLRFSVGFGKPLFKWVGKKDNTEYVLAAIPLGGYVKMLDEREAEVAESEKHLAFNTQNVWARIAIVAAGPIANFILAIGAYWLMYLIGISGIAPLVGEVEADSAAYKAGFELEDKILQVGSLETQTWNEVRLALLDQSLEAEGAIPIAVVDINQNNQVRSLAVDNSSLLNSKGDFVGKLGLKPWWPDVKPIIGGVSEGEAAEIAGLVIGDHILTADGEVINSWQHWVEFVRARANQSFPLVLLRDGQEMTLFIKPNERQRGDMSIGYIGAWETQSQEQIKRIRTIVQYDFIESLQKAATQTWNMSVLTLQMLSKLVIGEASIDNISGPITIAQFAGQSASVGFDHYLSFLALISISLGVLNLLPVPVLDGGHLLYFFVEVLIGKPVPENIQLIGQQIGMVLLAGLMSIAFYNDIVRLIG